MSELANTVASELAAYFENIAAKLHKWVDPLSDQQFLANPLPVREQHRPSAAPSHWQP